MHGQRNIKLLPSLYIRLHVKNPLLPSHRNET